MANLRDLEDRLNNDDQLRADFLANPADVFRREGIELPAQQERSLAQLVDQLKTSPQAVSGSSVSSQPNAIDISINISKNF